MNDNDLVKAVIIYKSYNKMKYIWDVQLKEGKNRENVKKTKLNYLFSTLLILIFVWHGVVKFSIWNGLNQFENNNYSSAISNLERVVFMYPKPIGRFHLILGQMYMENGNIEKATNHALKAQNINPDHDAPVNFLNKIKN